MTTSTVILQQPQKKQLFRGISVTHTKQQDSRNMLCYAMPMVLQCSQIVVAIPFLYIPKSASIQNMQSRLKICFLLHNNLFGKDCFPTSINFVKLSLKQLLLFWGTAL